MDPTVLSVPSLRPEPPPLWYVKSDDRVVGPVNTNLLLRGVFHERVPAGSWVRGHRWGRWRGLEKIREIGVLRRQQATSSSALVKRATWKDLVARRRAELDETQSALSAARDPGEVLLLALNQAMQRTEARVGAIHKARPPGNGYVTAYASGPGMHARLGRIVATDDPVLDAAWAGTAVCEAPDPLGASAIIGDRFGHFPASRGVMMYPITCGLRLYAMLELGRDDHAFRRSDLVTVRRLVGAVASELSVVKNRR